MALTAEEMRQIIEANSAVISQAVSEAVAAAIIESRKPLPPTDAELKAIEVAQQARVANAAGVIAAMENKRAVQTICSHEHKRKEGGGTHAVWVRDEDPRSPGYIYCQKCEAQIRPGQFNPDGLPCEMSRRAIYDTQLFNRLFQECGEQTIMG
jgi:hypothetical protein